MMPPGEIRLLGMIIPDIQRCLTGCRASGSHFNYGG
jgi:hypothetical protein